MVVLLAERRPDLLQGYGSAVVRVGSGVGGGQLAAALPALRLERGVDALGFGFH